MKVVLVHEWLTNLAGSEKVLLQMAKTFPEADIVVGVANTDLTSKILPGRSVRSLLSPKLPGILNKWQYYAPLLWLAWRFAKIDADVVIISSHFAGHQACHRVVGKSVVYYHTPMRIAWKFDLEKNRVRSSTAKILRFLIPAIQYLDRLPASKATRRLANSSETQRRIRDFYGCDSEILHPPVEPAAPTQNTTRSAGSPYYLCFGRLVDYKRIDHAILACNKLGRRLVVAGVGPAEVALRSISGPTIEFVGQVSETEKATWLANAQGLLFPGLEDFGIVPVEAMTHGTPVVALGQGGVLDSVNSETGVLYDFSGPDELAKAILDLEQSSFDSEFIKAHAAGFNERSFRERLRAVAMSI
ncbi:glycosyltransferase [Pseudarthrobacter sp. YS3]|uniref:glycosyltransferase n=1 Tax=Pseudarthrobacter sp. YS3 TaxID=3453718 RepID=UPI003EECA278